MDFIQKRKFPIGYQIAMSVLTVGVVAFICFFSTALLGYKSTALILMVTVSLIAALFDIWPVLIAALLSALIWNFFFIPPIFTFHIQETEDLLMFLMYFLIALVNAVLTFNIRREEKKVRDRIAQEKTIQLYNSLFNSLSHELRTPISTIMGAVDILKESTHNVSSVNKAELLNQIDIASVRLNRQVENLLNMSRLETGNLKPKLDWCDTNEMVYSVIQTIGISYSQKINFDLNEHLPFLKFDRGLIEQVLHNLIHNAIHYTPADARINIRITYEEGMAIFEIEDNGLGIPIEEQSFIFDKFYRLSSTKITGSGLGLSIVKGFVEAHNGNIKVINNQYGGASFIVQIPTVASYINSLKNE